MFNSASFTLAVQNSLIVYVPVPSAANMYFCIPNNAHSEFPFFSNCFPYFFPCKFLIRL